MVALLFAAAIIFAGLLRHNSAPATAPASVTPKPHAIYKIQTDEKVAALTFDISWGTKVPGPVMDILKEKQVQSTFFLSGPWTKQHPEFPRRLVADGHEIASHGNEHVNYGEHSKTWVNNDILTAQEAIKGVTGVTPSLIRTPNGNWNDMVLQTAQDLGYQVIQWSDDSLDWMKDRSPEQITGRVLDKVQPGAIILMHASDTCDRTPAALPAVIDGLRAKGYQLVTVSELLKYGPGVID